MNAEHCTYPRGGDCLCAYGIQAQIKGAVTLVFGLLIGAGLLLKASRFKSVAIWMCGLVITGTLIVSFLHNKTCVDGWSVAIPNIKSRTAGSAATLL